MVTDRSNPETATVEHATPIRAYKAGDGNYFCLYDEGADWWNIEGIEHLFYKADEDERVTDTLVPEPERTDDAPIVGTLYYGEDYEICRVTFDLSEWYGDGATYEFVELPHFGGGIGV